MILHLVTRDKFTSAYINFMLQYLKAYDHFFVTGIGDFELNVIDESKIYISNSIGRDKYVRELVYDAEKIIISGLSFGMEEVCGSSLKIIKKVYIQFWGRDFYDYRNKRKLPPFYYPRTFFIENKIWYKRLKLIKKCQAYIFLIDGEYEQFQRILGYSKKNFVAPVGGGETWKQFNYNKDNHVEVVPNRILLGNSATKENHHIDILHKLKKWNEQIEVICPLSYGDKQYAEEVIREGKNLFGERFKGITEFLELQNYIDLLASCSVAIIACDRQQAMGNISYLYRLRKKIYLRANTSMWNNYIRLGMIVHNIDEIDNETLPQFLLQSDSEKESNESKWEQISDVKNNIEKWKRVLEDQIV